MKINRQKLLKDLSLVKAGLASKEMLEQSTSFVFAEGFVYTYNDEIAVSHPVDVEFTGAVGSSELLGILGKAKDEELDFSLVEDSILEIKGKKFKATMALMPNIILPINEIQPPDHWKPLPSDFGGAIKFCLFSASKDMTKPTLTCVHAFKDRVESSDSLRLTRRYFASDYFEKGLLIPGNAAKELINFEAVEYSEKAGWVYFATEQDTVFACRTYKDLQFPVVDHLLQLEGETIIFPDEMAEMVERARVFTASQLSIDEKIKVSVGDGKLTVFGQGASSSFEETTRVRYKGEPCQFYISPDFLSDVLLLSKSAIVGSSRLLFEEEEFIHVLALCKGE